ncbi:MAG: AAA family ATPase [bacterium]
MNKLSSSTLANERAVIGSEITNHDAVQKEISDLVLTFQDRDSKAANDAITRLIAKGSPVDVLTIQKESGLPVQTIESLMNEAVNIGHVRFHALQVQTETFKRKLQATIEANQGGLAGLVHDVNKTLEEIPATQTHIPIESLADLPDPTPETENPLALFRNGYLRKGGGLLFVSPTGNGKSTWSIQSATGWAMGKPSFGIKPVRPLKIVIIQAEDDAEEMAFFRNQITDGLVDELGFDRQAINAAVKARVLICSMNGCTGERFTERLNSLLEAHRDIDLVIVNPLLSFAGCDLSRPAEATHFFRELIDPAIKPNDHGRVGILFVHHTNKPPQAKDRNGWGTDAFSAYIGSGGADISNWMRAGLALMPCENVTGVFRLVAGKRGKRLGWTDANGCATNTKYIAHSEKRIFWRDATDEEIAQAGNSGISKQESQETTTRADAKALATWACKGDAKSMTELRTRGTQTLSNLRTRRAIAELGDHPETYNVTLWQCEKTKRGFMGLASAISRKLQELGISEK